MRVCVGGTFYPFHRGHQQLLNIAIETAGIQGHVFIGVSVGEVATKKGNIPSFDHRKKTIESYLWEKKKIPQVAIQPIHDKYGPSVDGDFDAIVVSPETRPTAEEINRLRKQQGKKPLIIVEIPFVLAEDSHLISSTRIRKKEIDADGRLLHKE